MKIGLHIAAYQCADLIEKCLAPWLEYKFNNPGSLDISVGHVCFKENYEMGFPLNSQDSTEQIFNHLLQSNLIKYQTIKDPATEIEARNIILNPIRHCDYIWLTAPDEIYTLNEITKVVKYIENEPFVQTFKIEFKNLVFDDKHYVKGFCPTRIFQNISFKINTFIADDEVCFLNAGSSLGHWRLFSNKQIPTNICNPMHYTWINNERSKQKVQYQEKRWSPPNGFGCSFKIDKDGNLAWNEEYFKRTGQDIPTVYCLS